MGNAMTYALPEKSFMHVISVSAYWKSDLSLRYLSKSCM